MDPMRLVVIFYLLVGIVVAMFLDHVLGFVADRLGWSGLTSYVIEGLEWRWTGVLGALITLTGIVAAVTYPRTRQLSMEVAGEMMKVTWPSWGETRISTMAVVVASVVAAVLLFAIDTVAAKLMVEWLPTMWGKL
jgi:preprotein translocase subunit SecE